MQERLQHLQKHFKLREMPEVGTLVTGYREPLSVHPEIWITRQLNKTFHESLPLGRFHGRTEWQLCASMIDLMILAVLTQPRCGRQLRGPRFD